MERNPRSGGVKSEWPPIQSRGDRRFPRRTGENVLKVWEFLEKRRSCQAWIPEKETQGRPCPGCIPEIRPMSKLWLPTPCRTAAPWPSLTSRGARWVRGPGSWLGAVWIGNSKVPGRGRTRARPSKAGAQPRTLFPRSTGRSELRNKCLLGFIQHWLKGRDTG